MNNDVKYMRALSYWRRECFNALKKAVYSKVENTFVEQVNSIIKRHYAKFSSSPLPFIIFKEELYFLDGKEVFFRRFSGQKDFFSLHKDFHAEMATVLKEKDTALALIKDYNVISYLEVSISHCSTHTDLIQLVPSLLHSVIPTNQNQNQLTAETAETLKKRHAKEYKTLEEQLVMNMILT